MSPSKKEVEDRIVSIMRQQFLKYSDEVLDKYKDQINKLVRWYISTLPRHIAKHEADDLTSEAKIAFVDALRTWDPRRGELWSYVNFRLKGSMQDYLRKRGNDPVVELYEYVSNTANLYMAFNRKNIVHEKIDHNLHVDAAMKHLEEKEKAVIEGYYQKDMTFKAIGREIGLSESQVSRICKEATKKMRETMKDESLNDSDDNPPE